jgi:hypothetical protein
MTVTLSNCLPIAAPPAAARSVTEYQLQAWRHYEIRLAGALTRIGVARPGEQRCGVISAGLRCVRRPHPESPSAHVRVAGDPWWDWEGTGAFRPLECCVDSQRLHVAPAHLTAA